MVDNAIEILGSDRLMFGSNFPIEKLWTSHAELIAAHRKAVAKHGAEGGSRHLLEHGRARLPAGLNLAAPTIVARRHGAGRGCCAIARRFVLSPSSETIEEAGSP